MILVGFVDGVEISFNFTPPNLWEAVIPKKLNGMYIVQLFAQDDAGNITNYSNIFVKINFSKMEFEILKQEYQYLQNSKNFGYIEINEVKSNIVLCEAFSTKNLNENYSNIELVM